MSTKKDPDKLLRAASLKVKSIFKEHRMSPYRKIGLQKAFRIAIIEACLTGEIK